MSDKFIYQIISTENGNRSRPFLGSWDQVAKAFQDNQEHINMGDYLLLVAIVNEEQQLDIKTAPIIKLETFLEMFDKFDSLEKEEI